MRRTPTRLLLASCVLACCVPAWCAGCASGDASGSATGHTRDQATGEPVAMHRIFDDSRPLRVWRGELIKGNVRRDIDLWREVTGENDGPVRRVHAEVRERERARGAPRVIHTLDLEFNAQHDVFMTRVVEPRRALDVRFDPPLLVARGLMHAGEMVDTRSRAVILDAADGSTVKYRGTARQRTQVRATPAGIEVRSELSLDLGIPSLRLRSRLVLDQTDPDRPFASFEATDAMVKVGIAPVLREKREVHWSGESLDDAPPRSP